MNIFITKEFIIPIEINSFIIPFEFTFETYDFSEKKFTDQNIKLYYNKKSQFNEFILYFRVVVPNTNILYNLEIKKIYYSNSFDIEKIKENNITFSKYYSFSYKVKILQFIGKSMSIKLTSIINNKFKKNIEINFDELPNEINNEMIKSIVDPINKQMTNRIPIYQFNNKKWNKINDIKEIKYLNKIISPFGEWVEKIYFEFDYNSKTLKNIKPKDNAFIYIEAKGGLKIEYSDKIVMDSSWWPFSKNFYPIIGIYANKLWYPFFQTPYQFSSILFRTLYNKKEDVELAKNKLSSIIKEKSNNEFSKLVEFFNQNIDACETIENIVEYFPNLINERIKKVFKERDKEYNIIFQYNLIRELYFIFKERNDYFNKTLYLPKLIRLESEQIIDENELNKQIQKCRKEYFQFNKNIFELNIENKEIEEINNFIEMKKDKIENMEGIDIYLVSENIEPKPIQNFEEIKIIQENENIEKLLNKNEKNNIPLPNLSKPEKLSINSLNDFLTNCIQGARALPIYTRDLILNDKENIFKANDYFLRLNEIYKSFPEENNSFFESKINEFKDAFNSMVNKFERSSINFKDLKLKKYKIFENNIQDYIKYPEKDYFEKPEDKWESYEQNNYNNQRINNNNIIELNQNTNKYKTIDIEILDIDIGINKINPKNETNEIFKFE